MSEAVVGLPRLSDLKIFLWIALGWLGLAWLALGWLSPRETVPMAAAWVVALWALSVFDLLAMAKALAALLRYLGTDQGTDREKQFPLLIQASYWGLLKLTCLGLFTLVLLRGRAIPVPALILGMGTLVAVPLLGGFWWSFRSVKD